MPQSYWKVVFLQVEAPIKIEQHTKTIEQPTKEERIVVKKEFFKSRLFIFLVSYLSLAAIISIIAMVKGNLIIYTIGQYFQIGGFVVFLLAFLARDRRTREHPRSSRMISDEQFKRIRAKQKPDERDLIPIAYSGLAIAITGFLLNRISLM